ncbi:MAG: hypothetical protein ACK5AL_04855 [Planctomycetota bacterium]
MQGTTTTQRSAAAATAAAATLALAALAAACAATPPPAAPPVGASVAPAAASRRGADRDTVAAFQDDLAGLKAKLAAVGPDGREDRDAAIERLLTMPRGEAHGVLCRALAVGDDRDDLRVAIATALQRHLQLPPAQQFGGLSVGARAEVAGGYLRALLSPWRTDAAAVSPAFAAAARVALQRWPARELDAAVRVVIADGEPVARVAALRCLADLQQTFYAATLADWIESTDPALRDAARAALQLLTCSDEPIRTRADFAAWQQRCGELRYVDLVERAARRSAEPLERAKAELARLRIEAARDVVRAHVTRASGIDWPTVQLRGGVDDDAVRDACLEVLVAALPTNPDDPAPARGAFARALLQRSRAEPADMAGRRARLLEVAAYTARVEDAELAKELVAALVAQLDVPNEDVQVAAVRALRRFPSPETRVRLVVLGQRLFSDLPAAREPLAAIFATLGARTAPRWPAPSPTDADKAEWLWLVASACRSDEALDLRQPALALAQTLDAREQRVPEVFRLLLELVRDGALATKFRSNCAIVLSGWRADQAFAAEWLQAQHELLRDASPELRQQAAEALVTLVESGDVDRTAAIGATIDVVSERLPAETEPAVFGALAMCLQECGRTKGMPGRAIEAARQCLTGLGSPVAAEQQFRLDPLLQALATLGADARADRRDWLAACAPLLEHRRRQSLRLILSTHAAIDLATDVVAADPAVAEPARAAMAVLIETAALKPVREPWSSSEDLLREARDVRTAFSALDALPEKDRPDRASHRLLRLAVELVAGKPQDVVQRAAAWLAAGAAGGGANGASGWAGSSAGGPAGSQSGPAAAGSRAGVTEAEKDRMRVFAAEASLALGKPEAARKFLDERVGDDGDGDDPAVRELEAKVAKNLAATDLAGAVALYDRVLRRTAKEDPAFRGRLVDWARHRVQLDPTRRDETAQALATHAALFEAADCPADLRDQFVQLRAGR